MDGVTQHRKPADDLFPIFADHGHRSRVVFEEMLPGFRMAFFRDVQDCETVAESGAESQNQAVIFLKPENRGLSIELSAEMMRLRQVFRMTAPCRKRVRRMQAANNSGHPAEDFRNQSDLRRRPRDIELPSRFH